MTPDKIRLKQAQWVIGLLSPDQLVEFACQALEADVDSSSLRRLAGENKPAKWIVEPPFEQTLSELGIDTLNETQARLLVARNWAKQIVSGEISPYDGAKAIWHQCYDHKPGDRFEIFVGRASEHEDFIFARPGSPEMYDRMIKKCAEQIVLEAHLLLIEGGDVDNLQG